MSKLDDLTIGELKQIQSLIGNKSTTEPYEIGKNYFIRTVTMHLTGKLIAVYPNELVLEKSAWIADSGRFEQFIKEGKVKEVEPFTDKPVIVGRGSIIDATEWNHELPRSQK